MTEPRSPLPAHRPQSGGTGTGGPGSGKGWRGFLTACAGLALLGGCSVGPDFQPPELTAPTAWSSKSPAVKEAANAQASDWPAPQWWQGFGSGHLNQLIDQAQRGNFDLAVAVARVREADAQLEISGAPLLPSLSASLGASRLREASTSHPIAGKISAPDGTNLYSGILTASYQLDFWGKNRDLQDAASAAALGSRYDRQTTALTVQSGVATSYFTLLSLQDRLRAAQANLAAAEHILTAYRARLAVGTVSGLDVAQQENLVASQRAAIPPLVQTLRQTAFALAVLIGQAPEQAGQEDNAAAGLAEISLPPVPAGLPSGLLTRRPDVQSSLTQLVAANANFKAAEAALFPSLTLTAQGGLQDVNLSKLLQPQSILYSLGASVAQPIFEGGILRGGIELQKAKYEELLQTYRKSAFNAFNDVENALTAVEQTSLQELAQQEAVTTAQKAQDIAQAQLQGGTVDIVTLLNTQRSLYSAQDLLIQTRLAHAQALVSLFKALGGGWTPDDVQVKGA